MATSTPPSRYGLETMAADNMLSDSTRRQLMSWKFPVRILTLICCLNISPMRSFAQNEPINAPASPQTQPVQPLQLPERSGPSTADPQLLKASEEMNAQANVYWKPAMKFYEEGKLAEAEKNCLQAIAIHESYFHLRDNIGHVFLGEIYFKGRQYQKALGQFLLAVGRFASNRTLELDIALAYARLGNFAQAQKFYALPVVQQVVTEVVLEYGFYGKKANADNLPEINDAESLYANILLTHGAQQAISRETDEAIADFQQADKLRSKNPLVHLYWGIALQNQGNDSQAISHFQIAAQRGNGVVGKAAKQNVERSQQNIEALRQRRQAKKPLGKTPAAPTQPPTPDTPQP